MANKIEQWNGCISISVSAVQRACKMIKEKPQYKNEQKLNVMFSDRYCKDLMYRQNFIYTTKKSDQKKLTAAEITELRDSLQSEIMKLQFEHKIPTENILNADESPVQPMVQNRIGFRKKNAQYKLEGSKTRFTFLPVISSFGTLNYPPAFVTKSKCLSKKQWNLKSRREFKKNVTVGEKSFCVEQIQLEFKNGLKCVTYVQPNAWVNSGIFKVEIDRLSKYLSVHYPDQKYLLLLDNCGGHAGLTSYENLVIHFFKPQVTGIVQPLDQTLFGLLKKKYRKWLEGQLIDQIESGKSKPSVSEGVCCEKVLEIFSNFDSNVATNSFK